MSAQFCSHRNVSCLRRNFGLLLALVLMIVLLQFAVGNLRSYTVVSRSMEPTLLKGDYLLVARVLPDEKLEGKVIAFEDFKDGSALTKRVLADHGQQVEVRNGSVFIDGQPDTTPAEPAHHAKDRQWRLKPGTMFVAGDNRNRSFDSIDHGPIPKKAVIGEICLRYWPLDRLGLVR